MPNGQINEVLRVTDLTCNRLIADASCHYQHRMPGVGKQTYKMGEGKAAQDMVEQLEMRRTLREYGFEGAVRKFGAVAWRTRTWG